MVAGEALATDPRRSPMDPGNGNIYTEDEARRLGLDFDRLIPLDKTTARRLLEKRRRATRAILGEEGRRLDKARRRARNRAARASRKVNR
jgi:hypothetical protein